MPKCHHPLYPGEFFFVDAIQIAPGCRIFLEYLTACEEIPQFCGTQFLNAHKIPSLGPLLSHSNPFQTLTLNFCNISSSSILLSSVVA